MELVRNTNAYESARVDEVPNPVAGGLALVEPISEDLQPDTVINYRDQTWEEALEARRLQDDTEKNPGRINRIRVGAAAIAIVGLAKLSKYKHNAVAQAEQLRRRAEDIWYRGNAGLENLKFYMTDPEKGRRRQATTLGAIIGFSALVLANRYGAFDFGDDSNLYEAGSTPASSDPSVAGIEALPTEAAESSTVPETSTPINTPIDQTPEVPSTAVQNSRSDPTIDTWSWNVAHSRQPGNETELMNKALAIYSKKTGLSAELVPYGGTTMIKVGQNIVNHHQMLEINSIIKSL